MSVIKTDPRKNSDTPVLSGLTSHIKNHILKYVGFIIQDVEFTGRIYIIMENESNYDLYLRLTPTSWATGLLAAAARNELTRRAAHGDGEAKMLLEIHRLEPARKQIQGRVMDRTNLSHQKPGHKFIYTLHFRLG